MSKFVRAAQTSQSLSLAAMEEASRFGLRVADLEHLFLALVISDQPAGHTLRNMGIDLDGARRAVEEQHDAQLAALGIEAAFPDAGRIVFHETDGYEWSARARDLIAKSSGKGKAGDAEAVLQELIAEPSGLIVDILERLDTKPETVLEHLTSPSADTMPPGATVRGQPSSSTDVFVSAPMDAVWELLADPARIPEWEPSLGSVEDSSTGTTPGTTWQGHAPTSHPDGKPVKVKPIFRRRHIELLSAQHPERITWSFGFPDVPRSGPVVTEFVMAKTTGGTQVRITRSWSRREGWRGLVARPLRPIQRFIVWITLFQIGSSISRGYR